MDTKQRNKLLLFVGVGLVVIIVIIAVATMLTQKSDLPPTKNQSSPSSATPSAPDTSEDEDTTYKDDVQFKHFGELERYAIPTYRIEAIQSTLATYANDKQFNSFTMDTASTAEKQDGERTIFTFNVTNDKGSVYKVELSYTFTADAYVRVFNQEGIIVETSPYD